MATIEPLVRNAPQREALRKRRQSWRLCLSLSTMAFGLFWLCWILIAIVGRRFEGMSAATFLEMTPPPNTAGGGLANALESSGLLISWATLIGTPLGVLAGVYLAEHGRRS